MSIIEKLINKDLNYYNNLPWTYKVEKNTDNGGKTIYIVSVNELPGVKTDAYSPQDAFEEIKDAKEATFELYLEMGDQIPEPKKSKEKEFNGNITYRTTSEKHFKLVQEAKRKKQSINKILDEIVTKALFAKK